MQESHQGIPLLGDNFAEYRNSVPNHCPNDSVEKRYDR